ncbi:hypothetical protein F6X56_15270 [Rhodococcus erythropolis]|uniref:hypothetical protein n=1 Tax=Rhodococcus erythropolis TaxID=1833 RepID=UPI001246A0FF|nr:hypothetical protein [Rhodococcus erythropolis]QEX10983.1 hypothetical protein F6X56_15270 [Rhodococcus erythropolis]
MLTTAMVILEMWVSARQLPDPHLQERNRIIYMEHRAQDLRRELSDQLDAISQGNVQATPSWGLR